MSGNRRKAKPNTHQAAQQPRNQKQHAPAPPQPELDYDADLEELKRQQEVMAIEQRFRSLLGGRRQTRSAPELNLHVLKRWYPAVMEIVSISSYSVVYQFSQTTQGWEKCGIEGTLFICRLTPSAVGSERYAAIVLNRRSLDNFYAELTSSEMVEENDGYTMLTVHQTDGNVIVYGLWIHGEPKGSTAEANPMNETSRLLQHYAQIAETSLEQAMAGKQQAYDYNNGYGAQEEYTEEEDAGVAMARQGSLRELMERQREQDDGWSGRAHRSPATAQLPFPETNQPPPQQQRTQFDVPSDTEFFRSNNTNFR